MATRRRATQRPLERYRDKRSFARTPEPPAKATARRTGPLLFVVQKHAARRLHYDFRLELDGVLKSWAVPKGPTLEVSEKRLAVEVEDHPFAYASFEGSIPAGEYGAGEVIVWDCGPYSPDEGDVYDFRDRRTAERRVRDALQQGKLSFFLRGEKLKGSFALVRTATDKQWLLLKHKDRFADGNVLSQAQSVLSGRTCADLRGKPAGDEIDAVRLGPAGPAESLPKQLAPMLATPGERPQSRAGWLYEPKIDGYRAIASIDGTVVRLRSRRGMDLTAAFPGIVRDLGEQAVGRMVLDGEIVALGQDGRPSFHALQERRQLKGRHAIARAERETPALLICFDLLHFAGINLRASPYTDRRRYLTQCLLPSPHVQLIHASPDAEQLFAAALASGFEGIVGKRADAVYEAGKRSRAWVKFKQVRTAEFVVGGYTHGKGSRAPLGALLLGYWHGRRLEYAGHVGSGIDERTLDQLSSRFAGLERQSSPFAGQPDLHRPTRWLEPMTVVEVSFSEWTPGGHLRAPVFIRVRDDVPARRVRGRPVAVPPPGVPPDDPVDQVTSVLEQLEQKSNRIDLAVGDARIRLTNLDRVYWPGTSRPGRSAVTKRDFLKYLAGVSPYMLPHLADRPLTMIRMPTGIDGERFFQKHWEQSRPEFVQSVTVYSGHKNELHEYLLANDLATLLWLGQVGTLEFHVWHSRASAGPDGVSTSTDYSSSPAALEASVLNYPDYLVFDLDPYIYSGKEPKGAEPELSKKGFAGARRVAFWLRDLLHEMSLDAVVKTSGKTGLHVFVPIERTVTFDEARHLCELVGRHLLREHARVITMAWSVEKRTGRIFIDYNMNVRGKTLNVAYSPRGVPGAPVSMPLTWEELEAAEPMQFTIGNVLARLEKSGDRWHDVLCSKQSLARALASPQST